MVFAVRAIKFLSARKAYSAEMGRCTSIVSEFATPVGRSAMGGDINCTLVESMSSKARFAVSLFSIGSCAKFVEREHVCVGVESCSEPRRKAFREDDPSSMSKPKPILGSPISTFDNLVSCMVHITYKVFKVYRKIFQHLVFLKYKMS